MVQRLAGFGLKGTGIVAVLIIAGIALAVTGVNLDASKLALTSGIGIGTILGCLGIVGVIITLGKRIRF